MEFEYSHAKVPSKKKRRVIRSTCEANLWFTDLDIYRGRYSLITKEGIVFIVAPPQTIITVFQLDNTDGHQAILSKISNVIHYPMCWDTVAYPTLLDAIKEMSHCQLCEDLKV